MTVDRETRYNEFVKYKRVEKQSIKLLPITLGSIIGGLTISTYWPEFGIPATALGALSSTVVAAVLLYTEAKIREIDANYIEK